MNSQRFEGIQSLRFVAAALVLAMHSLGMVSARLTGTELHWSFGAFGVPLFFVISGFVMVLAIGDRRGPREAGLFFAERLARIAPMYWLVTAAKLGLVLALPALAASADISPAHVAASFVFIPHADRSGDMFPLLQVGWTLNLEMFFYLALAAWVALGVPSPALSCAAMLAALVVSGVFFSAPPVTDFLTSPIVLDFCAGAFIGHFWRRGWLPLSEEERRDPVFMGVYGGVAAAFVVVGFFAAAITEEIAGSSGLAKDLLWGAAATMIVGGMIMAEPFLAGRLPRWLLALGDASYALYLTHTLVIAAVAVALARMAPGTPIVEATILALALSVLVGCVAFRWVERPLTRKARGAVHRAEGWLPARPRLGWPISSK